jgi:hypothetical protein
VVIQVLRVFRRRTNSACRCGTSSTFQAAFRPSDSLYFSPIWSAGGTEQKNISSEDIIIGLGRVAFNVPALGNRDELLTGIIADARSGDCVLLMSVRDPSMPALTKNVVIWFPDSREREYIPGETPCLNMKESSYGPPARQTA